jgi:hypothetical protein
LYYIYPEVYIGPNYAIDSEKYKKYRLYYREFRKIDGISSQLLDLRIGTLTGEGGGARVAGILHLRSSGIVY